MDNKDKIKQELLYKLAKLMNVNSMNSIEQVITGICKIKYNDTSRLTVLKEMANLIKNNN